MKDSEKQINDWQEKVKHSFEGQGQVEKFLYETMDNFYYRYLETVESKNLKTQKLSDKLYGAQSFESNMVDALKNPNANIKPHIMELAKRIPKAQKPMVRYTLAVSHQGLNPDSGKMQFLAEVSWDFPNFTDASKSFRKTRDFRYNDLAIFRKQLALELESVCEIFIS